jgi:hypothetical protein
MRREIFLSCFPFSFIWYLPAPQGSDNLAPEQYGRRVVGYVLIKKVQIEQLSYAPEKRTWSSRADKRFNHGGGRETTINCVLNKIGNSFWDRCARY